MHNWRRIGEILQQDFEVDQKRIDAALTEQLQSGERLGQILIKLKVLDSVILAKALAVQFELSYLETIAEESAAEDLFDVIPIGFAKEYRIYPLERLNGRGLPSAQRSEHSDRGGHRALRRNS
jgi:general secretion pathway protein E